MPATKQAGGVSLELPALVIKLIEGDKVVKTIKMPDPREAVCREFNSESCGRYRAVPA